jgi:hypothetical protein
MALVYNASSEIFRAKNKNVFLFKEKMTSLLSSSPANETFELFPKWKQLPRINLNTKLTLNSIKPKL